MFRSPKYHPQGVRQALLQLSQCTINMYAYVGDVGACLLDRIHELICKLYFTGMFPHHLHKRTC